MYNFFDNIHGFFMALTFSLGMSEIFVIFGGFFLATILCVLILTARAYESRLIKAIDMFNNYFIDNPQVNEDNLVAFNNKMKSKKVPKQLRKQWQQFVLYREHSASHYMSFESCVSNPIRNSAFKIDILVMNIIAYISALLSLLLGFYAVAGEVTGFLDQLQQALVLPVLILLVNFLVTIFLNLRHNAIVSDLYQNYQYFEVNIDKATKTLPDYVDYEVLFDKNEIKRGIPILYAYLQKRAEEEQRELELARLKNIEHEKFNFDEAGVAGSLVLERAMQEAENYIAERKKYNQDTEQINSDMTQEDMNYREITKEYNRQMQVSKESFANYKTALEEASSSIEANYLKKQQQQELDRQRNLEREFDTATERHKKVMESFQSDLDEVDKFRAESRKNLESAMMSEFSSYGSKVYDEVKKAVDAKQKEKFDKLQADIKELEERLAMKDQELENAYAKNQELTESLDNYNVQNTQPVTYYTEPEDNGQAPQEFTPEYVDNQYSEVPAQEPVDQSTYDQPVNEESYDYAGNLGVTYEQEPVETFNYEPVQDEYTEAPVETFNYEPVQEEYNEEPVETFNYEPIEEQVQEQPVQTDNSDETTETFNYEPIDEFEEPIKFNFEPVEVDDVEETFNYEPDQADSNEEPEETSESIGVADLDDNDSTEQNEESIKSGERYDDKKLEEDLAKLKAMFNFDDEEEKEDKAPKRKAGRPRKIKDTEDKPKRRVGRPKKVVSSEVSEDAQPKRKVGRPKKVRTTEDEPKRRVGRPKKDVSSPAVAESQPKRKAGRPKKVKSAESQPKRRVGRPKKVVSNENIEETPKKKVGRPKKSKVEKKTKKSVGRPKKVVSELANESAPKRKAGRPRKKSLDNLDLKNINAEGNSENLDKYLEEIDKAIANEQAAIEKAKQEFEKKTKIQSKKK